MDDEFLIFIKTWLNYFGDNRVRAYGINESGITPINKKDFEAMSVHFSKILNISGLTLSKVHIDKNKNYVTLYTNKDIVIICEGGDITIFLEKTIKVNKNFKIPSIHIYRNRSEIDIFSDKLLCDGYDINLLNINNFLKLINKYCFYISFNEKHVYILLYTSVTGYNELKNVLEDYIKIFNEINKIIPDIMFKIKNVFEIKL